MNNRFTFAARSLTTLFVGFLFWSMGGVAGWRTLQMQGMAHPRFIPKPESARLTAAAKTVSSDRDKLAVTRRMGDALKDPAKLTDADIAATKATWGGESAKMLSILRDSAQ